VDWRSNSTIVARPALRSFFSLSDKFINDQLMQNFSKEFETKKHDKQIEEILSKRDRFLKRRKDNKFTDTKSSSSSNAGTKRRRDSDRNSSSSRRMRSEGYHHEPPLLTTYASLTPLAFPPLTSVLPLPPQPSDRVYLPPSSDYEYSRSSRSSRGSDRSSSSRDRSSRDLPPPPYPTTSLLPSPYATPPPPPPSYATHLAFPPTSSYGSSSSRNSSGIRILTPEIPLDRRRY